MNLLEALQTETDQQAFAVGDYIFRQGEIGTYMYVVAEGFVDVSVQGSLVRTMRPGDLFGEMALIDDSPRSADAIAMTDCKVAAIDERQFLFLIHETPMFALQVMTVMADRLRKHLP